MLLIRHRSFALRPSSENLPFFAAVCTAATHHASPFNIARLPRLITPVDDRQPAAARRSEGSPVPGAAVDLSIRLAAASQVAARAKKASLFSGSLADSAQDRH